jgi:two-component system chemotaxis response regulator CheB
MKVASPVRFRCQVGHGYSGDVLLATKEEAVDEAIRVALRIVEERAVLTEKMAAQARANGHISSANGYEQRAHEYRAHADVLRRAALDVAKTA